ncbi:unnamed protein product [Peronospora belbahrii]|uniref:Uncharacterized protein n=1 Tax=Peronospora belbahrii TaxID=622444 RepID=A0AAU9KJA7_9STRA|nr:unnamed protein product [Peronospora belbahrii]
MFWRRSAAKKAAVEETDDLVKLQKQFGIVPINDSDVETEFQALFGSLSSPIEEERRFSGIDNEDENEEATILRDLQLEEDQDESDGHDEAKNELYGLLEEAHTTARESHWREVAEMKESGELVAPLEEQIRTLKMQALALKKAGKVQDALVKFREAKQLQEKLSKQGLRLLQIQHEKPQHYVPSLKEIVLLDDGNDDDDGGDVKVTDEDLQDPEFLAQLARMGFTEDDRNISGPDDVNVMQELSALEAKIYELKFQAVQFKRENKIADALACMRKMKELEAKRDEQRSSSVISLQVDQKRSTLEVAKSVDDSIPDNSVSVVHSSVNTLSFDTDCSESNNHNITDIAVPLQDMNDPDFAVELQNLGDEDASPLEPVQTEFCVLPSMMLERKIVVNSRSLRKIPSIDEDYLIDAFDYKLESDEEESYRTLMMSSTPLRPPPSLSEGKSILSSAEYEHTTAEIFYVSDLFTQLQKVRQTALFLKQKGDIQGALEAMKRAKQIQNHIDHKQQVSQQPASTLVSVPNVANTAKFQEIEQLLVDFGNRAMVLAKESLSVNREKASDYLSRRKRYSAELEKLRLKRQNPLQLPPHYEIVRSSRNVVFELPFVQDDQIMVLVKSVNGLSQVADKFVFVKFCLNFPSGASHEGQTAEFQISSNASFSTKIPVNPTSFVFKLTRSRGTMRLFEIKKAVFEVWKPATLFRNSELVARAYQPLAPLLTCCEINTHIPFLGPNRKPCGGDIEIALQMRRPMKEKEIRLETVEELVIGEYFEPMTSSLGHVSMSGAVMEQASASSHSLAMIGSKPTRDHQSAVLKEDQASSASAPPDDPHDLDLIVSYDVMNEELVKVAAKLPSLTGPTAIEWSDRYDSLALKKQLLEIEMQTGKLTLEMYMERLHLRISADRVLISQLLTSNRRLDAARVLHRIKVMEKELKGTECDPSDT